MGDHVKGLSVKTSCEEKFLNLEKDIYTFESFFNARGWRWEQKHIKFSQVGLGFFCLFVVCFFVCTFFFNRTLYSVKLCGSLQLPNL